MDTIQITKLGSKTRFPNGWREWVDVNGIRMEYVVSGSKFYYLRNGQKVDDVEFRHEFGVYPEETLGSLGLQRPEPGISKYTPEELDRRAEAICNLYISQIAECLSR